MMNNLIPATGDNWRQLEAPICFKVSVLSPVSSFSSPYKGQRTGVEKTDPAWNALAKGRIDLLRPACGLASKDIGKRRAARQAVAMTQPWRCIAFARLPAIRGHRTAERIHGLPTGSAGLSGYLNRSQALPKSFDIESIPDCPPVTSASRQCKSPFERDLRRVSNHVFHSVEAVERARGPGDRSSGETGIERGLHRIDRQIDPGMGGVAGTNPAPPNIDLSPSIRGLFLRNLWVWTKSWAVVFRRRPVLKIRASHER
jgi:hypothetical protein